MEYTTCSFLTASRRSRLIAILPATEIAIYSITFVVAEFGHSSRYFHVNSFDSQDSIKLALHVDSLRLLCIPTISYASALRNSHYATRDKGCIQLHFIAIQFLSTSRHELAQSVFNVVWFFSFAALMQSMCIECGFDAHVMPGVDAPTVNYHGRVFRSNSFSQLKSGRSYLYIEARNKPKQCGK